MTCKEITEESLKKMSDNDLCSLYEDCFELGHPLKLSAALEILRRLGQPSNNTEDNRG